MYNTSHKWSTSLTNVKGRTGSTQTSKGALSGKQMGPRPYKGTVTGVYRWGLRRGHSFSLGLYTLIFGAEIYAIKA